MSILNHFKDILIKSLESPKPSPVTKRNSSSKDFLLTVQNRSCFYTIVRSPRRKHMQIKINPSLKVSIHIPSYMSDKKAHFFIQEKSKWIFKNLKKVKNLNHYLYQNQEEHYYLGKLYPLEISTSKSTNIYCHHKNIFIQASQNDSKHIQNILSQWYLIEAKKKLPSILEDCWIIFSEQFSYSKPTLKIKRMKTRWGSLSSKGCINLNSYLMQSSIECIQYVIFHELSHLVHFNHSRQFHQIVEVFCPNWKTHHTFLKTLNLKE